MTSAVATQSAGVALVAEDDTAQRMLMEQALSQAGFTVVAVADGAAALEYAVAHPPDIVFLDVVMPHMTGLQACRAIRDALGTRCPPIVVVTSQDGDDAIAEGVDAGATDYLIKPVNWTLLLHRVRGWLTAYQAAQEARPVLPARRERTLQVSRRGVILTDSDVTDAGASALPSSRDDAPELAAVLAPPFAAQVMACVRKVLKTREPADMRYAQWEAHVSAEGLDKARVVICEASAVEDAAAAEMFRLAYLDAVTGLPNRHLFERTAEDSLMRARLRGLSVMLRCVTCDAFAALRPDQPQLRRAARTLADEMVMRLRDTDHLVRYDSREAGDTPVASTDGVLFLVLVANADAPGAVPAVVDRIHAACAAAAEKSLNQLSLAPRIGVARFPEDADTLPALIERAIMAAGEARQQRDTQPRPARAPARPASPEFLADLAGELRQALTTGQIRLHYQPRIELATGQVAGAEALLRWAHPLRGMLSAGALIAMAESAGEAGYLTDWALGEACRQAAIWARDLPCRLRVSVNTSECQLARADFAQRLIGQVAGHALDPTLIEIEVGEQFLDISDAVLAQLFELRQAGIGLIVDDFCAGRASLGALRRLRIGGFKIDRAQLRANALFNEESGIYALTASIARARQGCVIAKGIESAEELAVARARGCDQAQGLHICQPLPVAEFERYLAHAGTAAAAGI
jgi:EAL domain-containing protein (putative c-di-GMP-specific phosphodiesterase class I)/PleD family two-component response regulator